MQVIPDGIPGLSEIASPALPLMQTLPFIVALVVLHFLLFKPLLAWLQGREDATEGARQQAADLQVEVDRRLEEIQGRVSVAHAEGRALRAEARAVSLEEEQRIVSEAKASADATLGEAIAEVREEQREASGTLKGTAATLARDIANQVLGRSISA